MSKFTLGEGKNSSSVQLLGALKVCVFLVLLDLAVEQTLYLDIYTKTLLMIYKQIPLYMHLW